MSRRRNRHRSLSNNSRMSQRPQPQSPAKHQKFINTTARSFYTPTHSQTHFNSSLQASEQLYNRNISFFRDNFNQNDNSQLPFMSSLREPCAFKQSCAKTATICFPFEAALKNTSNQIIKKKISDFSSKQTRLSGAYYRWHNQSGLNNKWAANFQCTLRDYGQKNEVLEKNFYPYVKPIVYNDVEDTIYEKAQLICNRRSKSFKISNYNITALKKQNSNAKIYI